MHIVEILKTFAPDDARLAEAKVTVGAPHLSHAERVTTAALCEQIERTGHTLAALAMQHVGPVGDVLDFGCTLASAAEALCQFTLNRALMNPHELAAAKCGISEASKFATVLATNMAGEAFRKSEEGYEYAESFLARAVPIFTPLFEDLERHAQARFPHLAG